MQVYQGAKKLNISNKELMELIDCPEVDHHMDRIPDEMLADLGLVDSEFTETVDTAETAEIERVEDINVVEEVLAELEGKEIHKEVNEDQNGSEKKCPYTLAEIELGIRGCGSKSSMWKWRHLLDE